MSQQFCLKWNNHKNLMEEFKHFLSIGIMVDVTLACDGKSVKAHKIVLSACSPFFRSLFLENPCKHPIVILKDVKYTELKAVLDFMYQGEINVAEDQLSALIKTAQTLRVKGLGEELPECLRNDRSSYEYKNSSDHESENQSEDELSNLSVCTLDVCNETLGKKETVTNQNENFVPEIKEEVPDDTNLSAVTMPLSSHSHNSNFSDSQQKQPFEQSNDKCVVEENFQDSKQNLVGQCDGFQERSDESSPQSVTQEYENCLDSPSSSISETTAYMYPSDTYQKPGTSSVPPHENLQRKESEEIPSRTSGRQSFNSRKSKVISDDESNSRKALNKIKDSGSANRKMKFHKCNTCSFMALHMKNLKRHIAAVHEETGQFQCNQCSYATASKSQLVYHIESVHLKEKPHHCSLCTYKAARADTLRTHIDSVHERKKPFKCEKCDYCTAQKRNLNRHVIAIHEKKKKFACPHCSYRSNRRECVNGHLQVHRKKK